jgi:hypothetical protein
MSDFVSGVDTKEVLFPREIALNRDEILVAICSSQIRNHQTQVDVTFKNGSKERFIFMGVGKGSEGVEFFRKIMPLVNTGDQS